jgi:hypothetical protein
LADASRHLYRVPKQPDPLRHAQASVDSELQHWVNNVDTRKMTKEQYKNFLAVQQRIQG